jgi:predicted metal-dependent hydrolase
MRLTVASDGTVRLSIPYYVSHRAAIEFALSKQDWLAQHIIVRKATLQNAQAIGKSFTLRFVINFQVDAPQTRLKGSEVIVNYPSTADIQDGAVQKAAANACVRALRQEAEDLLPSRVADIAQRFGFTYKSVIIKKLKGRWGSCDQHNNIVLNLFLMQLPWPLIDYVILHELVHTKHLNHGPDFWDEFLSHDPQARVRRKEIRAYQPNFVLPDTIA